MKNTKKEVTMTGRRNGLCPHCYKPRKPKGVGVYKLFGALTVFNGVFFGICALCTLVIILFDGEGDARIMALCFGIALLLSWKVKKVLKNKMDAQPCSFCGKNVAGELVGLPSDDFVPKSSNHIEKGDIDLENTQQKVCACCGAYNPRSNKICNECGVKFGTILTVNEGKKRIWQYTCPGCGNVYQLKKNSLFIIVMIVIGLCLVFSGFLSAILIGILCFVLVGLHLTGKRSFFATKKCPVCHKTPFEIWREKQITGPRLKARIEREEKRNQKILQRKETKLVVFYAGVNNWIGTSKIRRGLLQIILIIRNLICIGMILLPGNISVSWGGIGFPKTMLYGDVVFNFGGTVHSALLCGTILLIWITSALNLSKKTRSSGLGLKMGILTTLAEITLIILNSQKDWKYINDGFVYNVSYDATIIVNLGFLICLIITFLESVSVYYIEREKRYDELTKK